VVLLLHGVAEPPRLNMALPHDPAVLFLGPKELQAGDGRAMYPLGPQQPHSQEPKGRISQVSSDRRVAAQCGPGIQWKIPFPSQGRKF
jgi:hypothetical protein